LGNSANDGAPRIAVVTGIYDRMQDVLAKTGLGTVNESGRLVLGSESFDLFDGDDSLGEEYREFSELFQTDPTTGNARINNYDIVFINCGATEFSFVEVGPTYYADPEDNNVKTALFTYVTSGGRLYATDWAYDYIEQTFPEYIDFYGSESTVDRFEPELANAAEEGIEIDSNNATVLVDDLSSFLNNSSCGEGTTCLNNDGTLHVEGFLPAWAIIEGAHAESTGVTIYTEGFAPASVDYLDEESETRPLMVSIDIGEGKVFFSSYHTENLISTQLLPQERALQFLVFE